MAATKHSDEIRRPKLWHNNESKPWAKLLRNLPQGKTTQPQTQARLPRRMCPSSDWDAVGYGDGTQGLTLVLWGSWVNLSHLRR